MLAWVLIEGVAYNLSGLIRLRKVYANDAMPAGNILRTDHFQATVAGHPEPFYLPREKGERLMAMVAATDGYVDMDADSPEA
jgi:hypothetical protein